MMILVLIHFILVIILQKTVIPGLGSFGIYILRPLLWLSLAVTTYLFALQKGKNILIFTRIKRWYLGNSPIQGALIIGGFQVSMLIILGLFTTFGRSPYSFSPRGIMLNGFYVACFLIGTELARSYLVNTSTISKKQVTLAILLTTLLFLLIEIPFQNPGILLFENPPKSLEFYGKTIITAITMNLLATYLAYLGGATASVGYRGVLLCFHWFSPLLPKPHWTLEALIGTIAPAIGFLILQDSLLTTVERRQMNRKNRKKQVGDSWTIVAILSVIIVFFSFGYLGVTPTVIYSGSMAPTYNVGDIVLIDDVDTTTLQVGDIVQYISFDNTTRIIHRIIEIEEIDGRPYFHTQGDANPSPDFRPIPAQRIIGAPRGNIPKLGWVQIVVKSGLNAVGIPI